MLDMPEEFKTKIEELKMFKYTHVSIDDGDDGDGKIFTDIPKYIEDELITYVNNEKLDFTNTMSSLIRELDVLIRPQIDVGRGQQAQPNPNLLLIQSINRKRLAHYGIYDTAYMQTELDALNNAPQGSNLLFMLDNMPVMPNPLPPPVLRQESSAVVAVPPPPPVLQPFAAAAVPPSPMVKLSKKQACNICNPATYKKQGRTQTRTCESCIGTLKSFQQPTPSRRATKKKRSPNLSSISDNSPKKSSSHASSKAKRPKPTTSSSAGPFPPAASHASSSSDNSSKKSSSHASSKAKRPRPSNSSSTVTKKIRFAPNSSSTVTKKIRFAQKSRFAPNSRLNSRNNWINKASLLQNNFSE
jgi:hypothetical protein